MADDFEFADLMARICQGDQAAWRQLKLQYSGAVRSRVGHRLPEHSPICPLCDVDDVEQEVWVALWRRIRMPEGRTEGTEMGQAPDVVENGTGTDPPAMNHENGTGTDPPDRSQSRFHGQTCKNGTGTERPDPSQSQFEMACSTPAALMAFLNRLADTAVAREQRKQLARCRDMRRRRTVPAHAFALAAPADDAALEGGEREATEDGGAATDWSSKASSEQLSAAMRPLLTDREFLLLWLPSHFRISWRNLAWFVGSTAPAIRGQHYRIRERLRRQLSAHTPRGTNDPVTRAFVAFVFKWLRASHIAADGCGGAEK